MAVTFWGGIVFHVAVVWFISVGWRPCTKKKHTPTVDHLVSTCKLLKHSDCRAECPICFASPCDDNEDEMLAPRCGHAFHKECLKSWLKRHPTCPVCRFDLSVAVR